MLNLTSYKLLAICILTLFRPTPPPPLSPFFILMRTHTQVELSEA